MLRKLQQRSTFSCTDRTRKEKGGGGDKSEERMGKQRWQSSTEMITGRAADPSLESSALVSEPRVCVCTRKKHTGTPVTQEFSKSLRLCCSLEHRICARTATKPFLSLCIELHQIETKAAWF